MLKFSAYEDHTNNIPFLPLCLPCKQLHHYIFQSLQLFFTSSQFLSWLDARVLVVAMCCLSPLCCCVWVQCTSYMCSVWKCWWDPLKWPFFLSSNWNSATGEQSSAQPAAVVVVVLCVRVCVCMCACAGTCECTHMQLGINSVSCVPAGNSVHDDGRTCTSPARFSVTAAAAALEQGTSTRSRIHTHPRTAAPTQAPPPGWENSKWWDSLKSFQHPACFLFSVMYLDFVSSVPPRLAQGLWNGPLQTQHGWEDCVWERGEASLLALAGVPAGTSETFKTDKRPGGLYTSVKSLTLSLWTYRVIFLRFIADLVSLVYCKK